MPALLGRRAAIRMLAAGIGSSASALAEADLLIDLRLIRSHQEVIDAEGSLVEKTYKTSVGTVTITLMRERGRISGATAKLGTNVIARARVLSMSRDGAEVEETQFRTHDPNKPVYIGRLRYNSLRDRIITSTKINGTRVYELFIDWVWGAR